jgi:dipeptidyl aminopeptidase/acylaminoacyl peptidase
VQQCAALLVVLGGALVTWTIPAAMVHATPPPPSSTTDGPIAITGAATAASPVRAAVAVTVDGRGALPQYSVQYGTTTGYGSSTPARTATTSTKQTYRVALRDLRPGRVYHYRGVASTARGTTYGRDRVFATWPARVRFLRPGVVSPNNVISKPRNDDKRLGWVVTIHGGGWQNVGRHKLATQFRDVRFFNRLGWATYNIDYRKGDRSLPDVLAAYDALRDRVGPKPKICLEGHSAGGHLALMAAELRASVACVIAQAGPTDLVHLARQQAYVPPPPKVQRRSPALINEVFVKPSFGVDRKVLRQWSPVSSAGSLRVPVLLAASTFDQSIPQVQMRELARAMRAQHAPGTIKTMLLDGDDSVDAAAFTHAKITKPARKRWRVAEERLLERVVTRR